MKTKRMMLVALISLLMMPIMAQRVTEGSFRSLKGETTVQVAIDYSEAMIKGMTLEDYAVYEERWEQGKKEILVKFVDELNDRMQGRMVATISNKPRYLLVAHVVYVDGDGNTQGYITLQDANGKTVAKAVGFRGKGGKFGTHINLMGDGIESFAKSVWKFLSKECR